MRMAVLDFISMVALVAAKCFTVFFLLWQFNVAFKTGNANTAVFVVLMLAGI